MTLLADSVADVIRQLILDKNLGSAGSTQDWAVFTGLLGDLPDRAICVYNTAGRMDGRIMQTGEQIEHPGIQVLVRGFNYVEAELRARQIAIMFDGEKDSLVEIESNRWYNLKNISRSGAILPLGVMEDDRRRYHFAINATLTITEG